MSVIESTGNRSWNRAASTLDMDLTPGFRMPCGQTDTTPRENFHNIEMEIDDQCNGEPAEAQEMWTAFDLFQTQTQGVNLETMQQAFFAIPETLNSDLEPNNWLFFDNQDVEMGRQFLWVSTAGKLPCCMLLFSHSLSH